MTQQPIPVRPGGVALACGGLMVLAAVSVLPACSENSTPAATMRSAEAVVSTVEGRQLYILHCQQCHAAQGEGVFGMGPALVGSAAVLGDPDYLTEMMLLGIGGDAPGALRASGEYSLPMQSYAHLRDDEIAAILTYIRRSWGNFAPSVRDVHVTDIRDQL
ncbi:MAG: cytochrome c [Planctomycetota bacterium]